MSSIFDIIGTVLAMLMLLGAGSLLQKFILQVAEQRHREVSGLLSSSH
jgi:hypothetical protein